MGFIQIDPSLQIAEEISVYFSFLINSSNITFPKLSIPELITAKARPGLDSDATTATILSRFPECPIPNSPLSNGTPNAMEIFVKIIVEEIFNSIQSNMRIDLEVDSGIVVESNGANSGGPVISVGTSISPWTGTGVAS